MPHERRISNTGRSTAARLHTDRSRGYKGKPSRGGRPEGATAKERPEVLTARSSGRLQVFAFMSERGFFCQLPFDPSHTEIGAFSYWSSPRHTLARPLPSWTRAQLMLSEPRVRTECIRINKIVGRQS